jgi:hypothetical protein
MECHVVCGWDSPIGRMGCLSFFAEICRRGLGVKDVETENNLGILYLTASAVDLSYI